MKIMLKIWILLGGFVTAVVSQNNYNPDHLNQDSYDSEEKSYNPESRRHQRLRSYEDEPSSDPRHYQSLEARYPKHEPEPYARTTRYHVEPRPVEYHQPEDPSYHRPQEIVYHQKPQHYQESVPEHEESYGRITRHHQQPEHKEDAKYTTEEPKYAQQSHHSPRPVPVDPKLPLYFTMYEKRVIQDPLYKYGKGPWRFLTYGHGITYGSKEPGKVFEKGYGYIRALGRDHCKLPEHLCPPRDEKPFDYEGRKEPYFGYRPH